MKKLIFLFCLTLTSTIYALNVYVQNPRTGEDDIVFTTAISSAVTAQSNLVSKIVAGNNVSISPASGIGVVTVSASTAPTSANDTDCRASTGTIQIQVNSIAVSTGNFYSKAISDMTYAPRTATDTLKTYGDATYAPRTATDTLKTYGDLTYAVRTATDSALGLHATADNSTKLNNQPAGYYALATATDSINGLYLPISSGTSIGGLIDAKLNASSVPVIVALIDAKLNVSSGATISAALDSKLSASSGTDVANTLATKYDNSTVWYSTGSFGMVFIDTTAVSLVGLEGIQRVPFDAILKSWYIVADATGSATVAISTGQVTGSGLTFGTAFLTATLSTQQYATWASVGQTIPRGYYIKFVVLTCTTSKEIVPSVEVWRRQ